MFVIASRTKQLCGGDLFLEALDLSCEVEQQRALRPWPREGQPQQATPHQTAVVLGGGIGAPQLVREGREYLTGHAAAADASTPHCVGSDKEV